MFMVINEVERLSGLCVRQEEGEMRWKERAANEKKKTVSSETGSNKTLN